MKKGLHPDDYRPVVFLDINTNTQFLTRSTAQTEEKIMLDGVEYPLVRVHISSASHPFYTGEERIVDVEGRVDKFKAKRAAAQKARAERAAKAKSTKKIKSISQKPTQKPA